MTQIPVQVIITEKGHSTNVASNMPDPKDNAREMIRGIITVLRNTMTVAEMQFFMADYLQEISKTFDKKSEVSARDKNGNLISIAISELPKKDGTND